MRTCKTVITPLQPYVLLKTEDYQRIRRPLLGMSHFYEFHLGKGMEDSLNAVPDGSIDLVFNIGKDKVITYISGTVFGAKRWELGEAGNCFGVRFQPGQGELPKQLSMDMLINKDIEIDGNLFGENLVERIALAKDFSERCSIFEEVYQNMLVSSSKESDKKAIADYMIYRISETGGQISMSQLEDETKFSACYLRRVFKAYHGISPKEFAQCIRFQTLLTKVETIRERYDQIALDCGYYDEPHMMREFKKYAGMTLRQYEQIMRR